MNGAVIESSGSWRRRFLPRCQEWLLLAAYALGFWVSHRSSTWWGGEGYYSLWFPAAGVRFALLWFAGARLGPAAALTELGVQSVTGVVHFEHPDWFTGVIGVVRPCLAYALVVWAVRELTKRPRSPFATSPMPFGLAAVAAPIVAALAALPWSLLRPDITRVETARDIAASLTAFTVGDLLGTLLVAPPLLWIADAVADGRPRLPRIRLSAVVEALLVMAAALGAVKFLSDIGLGLQPTPVLLGIVWLGLRFGRAAAWVFVSMVAALALPYTAGAMPTPVRMDLHLSLAAIVVAGYLAGSFADAQTRARHDLERRDRLLYQAERLKTLRAMSVAVIHEISQPLSTLAIEAKHLHELARTAQLPLADAAALVDSKAALLSNLVRRLRRFGGRAVDEPSLLPVTALLDMVGTMARPEAKAAGVHLEIGAVHPDLAVLAQELELTQAFMNLVRNAVQASCDSKVEIRAVGSGHAVNVVITNSYQPDAAPRAGMGVGLQIARTIVEAHGGTLVREEQPGSIVSHVVALPLAGAAA